MRHGFWLGKYEVTQEQWKGVMGGDNSAHFKGDSLPVENVSWLDCQEFVQRVNAASKCWARLPTEHEWEYACRAGTSTTYSWGGALNGFQANCNGSSPYGTSDKGPYLGRTTPVGGYGLRGTNNWNFCDMHGNVWEWCADKCDSSGVTRVLRGGCWDDHAQACRSAYRGANTPDGHNEGCGFRLCCSAGTRNEEIQDVQMKASVASMERSRALTLDSSRSEPRMFEFEAHMQRKQRGKLRNSIAAASFDDFDEDEIVPAAKANKQTQGRALAPTHPESRQGSRFVISLPDNEAEDASIF